MCYKGQVGECKILFPYVAFISYIAVFIINIIYSIMVMVISINLNYCSEIV